MQQFLDRWIPDALRADAQALARVQLVLGFTTIFVAVAPLYGGYYLLKGYHFGGLAIVVAGLLAALIGPLLRATGSPALGGLWASTLLLLLMALLTTVSGGAQSHTAAWLAMPAVVALLLVGPRAARGFAALAVLHVLLLLALMRTGVALPNLLPEALRPTQGVTSVLGLIVVLYLVVRRFEHARDTALASATAAQVALLAEKRQVEARVEQAVAASEARRRELDAGAQEMLSAMRRFAAGDLSVRLAAGRGGEIGALYDGFNQSVANVSAMLAEVHVAAGTTALASDEIRQATRQLGDGARQQSARTQEVAAAMGQMAQTIADSSAHAQRSARGIEDVGRRAAEGGRVIRGAVEKIEQMAGLMENSRATVMQLGEATAEIHEVVQLISQIAGQTNLLALNATIEAARAGEHGKGFAVVATEVKQLAGQTAKATEQIAAMIQRVQAEAERAIEAIRVSHAEAAAGRQLADDAGLALREIEDGLQRSADVAGQIAAATEEQTVTTRAISEHVTGISQGTLSAQAEVERIVQSAERMRRLTDELAAGLARFRLEVAEAEAVRPAA
jgi:methyl-accepting chemotaxis protein